MSSHFLVQISELRRLVSGTLVFTLDSLRNVRPGCCRFKQFPARIGICELQLSSISVLIRVAVDVEFMCCR